MNEKEIIEHLDKKIESSVSKIENTPTAANYFLGMLVAYENMKGFVTGKKPNDKNINKFIQAF